MPLRGRHRNAPWIAIQVPHQRAAVIWHDDAVRSWSHVGSTTVAISLALSGCTDTSNEAVVSSTTSEPSNAAAADPTRAACSHFESMWVEQAQIDRSRHGSPQPDPHGLAAAEAAERAFDAAADGSQAARRLGAAAETLYNSGDPSDFNAKLTEFFRTVCNTEPPPIECEPQTLCEEQHLDSYGSPTSGLP